MARGYVYIMQNKAFPDLLKIGKTTRSPNVRAAELSSTGVPHPFEVLFAWKVADCHSAEAKVHRKLKHARSNVNREFFAVTPTEAEQVITRLLGTSPCTPSELSGHLSSSDLNGCLIAIVFVAIFWELMRTFGDPDPPQNSWSNRLWWILYMIISFIAIGVFANVNTTIHGRQSNRRKSSVLDGLAGIITIFALYCIYRIVRSFD